MGDKFKETEEFDELFRKFQTLLPLRKAPKTLLEITRFPHYELACSNILAFFLDPSEEHGLGDVFLKSIFEAADFKYGIDQNENLEIIREDRTDEGKSIDIVVVSDGFVLGIENKIFASALSNPFAQYAKRLENRSGEKPCFKILLSIKEEGNAGVEDGFIRITYDQLFAKLERHLGTKILKADQRCTVFLIDS